MWPCSHLEQDHMVLRSIFQIKFFLLRHSSVYNKVHSLSLSGPFISPYMIYDLWEERGRQGENEKHCPGSKIWFINIVPRRNCPSIKGAGSAINNKQKFSFSLLKVFQVAYILIQCGPSPRPGNWILERSINGQQWAPWQFFALSDEECWHAFGVEPRKGKPKYEFDEEVICTSYFSGLEPKENGEVSNGLFCQRTLWLQNIRHR